MVPERRPPSQFLGAQEGTDLPSATPPQGLPWRGAETLLSLGTQISNIEALPQILLVWIKPQNIKSKHLPPVNFLSYS